MNYRTLSLAPGTLTLALLLAAGCKKEEAPDPCLYTPTPRIDLNSWPSGLSVDSTWTVPRTDIPLEVYALADKSSDPTDVHLISLYVRIVATANDSVLYADDREPHSTSTSFTTHVALNSIPADIPASLRITTTNACGYSDAVVRKLLITPN